MGTTSAVVRKSAILSPVSIMLSSVRTRAILSSTGFFPLELWWGWKLFHFQWEILKNSREKICAFFVFNMKKSTCMVSASMFYIIIFLVIALPWGEKYWQFYNDKKNILLFQLHGNQKPFSFITFKQKIGICCPNKYYWKITASLSHKRMERVTKKTENRFIIGSWWLLDFGGCLSKAHFSGEFVESKLLELTFDGTCWNFWVIILKSLKEMTAVAFKSF